MAVSNSKDLVINAVKDDIQAGKHQANLLRSEFMTLIERMNEDFERK